MDRLSQWIKMKVGKRRWKPLKASRGGVEISRLFFADDLLLFVEAREDQVDCIREGLTAFCKASEQKVNFDKSMIFIFSNVVEQEAEALCRRMGVPRTTELGRYLGHHLVQKGRNRYGYSEIIQKVKDKLDGWKSKCLSRAG